MNKITSVTEKAMEKLDGKNVRFELMPFKFAIESLWERHEGKIEISHDDVMTYRDGKPITKTHVGFYLYPTDGSKATYFDYRQIKLIRGLEIIDD